MTAGAPVSSRSSIPEVEFGHSFPPARTIRSCRTDEPERIHRRSTRRKQLGTAAGQRQRRTNDGSPVNAKRRATDNAFACRGSLRLRRRSLGGCGRPASCPAVGSAAKSGDIQTADSEPSVAQLGLSHWASRPLPLSDTALFGDTVSSQVLRAAYPTIQVSGADHGPKFACRRSSRCRSRAIDRRLEPPQPSKVSPGEPLATIASFPPLGPATTAGPVLNFAPAAIANPIAGPMPRSDELDAVVRQADAQTAHGFELARRGAIFSARAEFIAALTRLPPCSTRDTPAMATNEC